MVFRGREWVFVKRYRDFESLHNQLLKESSNSEIKRHIPNLPQKRWFETGRWINRYAACIPRIFFIIMYVLYTTVCSVGTIRNTAWKEDWH